MAPVLRSPPTTPRWALQSAEELLVTRSPKVSPASAATAAAAEKLPNKCPEVVGKLLQEPSFETNLTRIGRCGPNFAKVDQASPNLIDFGRTLPTAGQIGPTWAKNAPNRPTLAGGCQRLAGELANLWPDVLPKLANLWTQTRPMLVEKRHCLVKVGHST